MHQHTFNGPYDHAHLERVAFPLGGIGAGMLALEGTGKLGQVSLRHAPELFNEPYIYAAIAIQPHADHDQPIARLLEGPTPAWKTMFPWGSEHNDSGTGGRSRTYGFPRFQSATFTPRFPFATVTLTDPNLPLRANITGWSPFTPPDSDNASLPLAALEYQIENITNTPLDLTFSFHTQSFMHCDDRHHTPDHAPQPRRLEHGFCIDTPGFDDAPWAQGHFAAFTDTADTHVDCAWFRGQWFDTPTQLWQQVATAQPLERSPHQTNPPSQGASLYRRLHLKPGESQTIPLMLAWYVPHSNLRVDVPTDGPADTYQPWYAGRFTSIDQLAAWWQTNYADLRQRSARFRDALFASTLPPEVMEAVAANLSILKSPTVLRQKDGRLWAWEGCHDTVGCCPGSCTHVWNYAQALPHLFPDLERSLRETEFRINQATTPDNRGHQSFRAPLPIIQPVPDTKPAADGQLGGIIKTYRDWRIAGDTDWLRSLWPQLRDSLDYAIRTWDPEHQGAIIQPHHNTYDIEFHGPNGMTTSIYHAALHAAIAMGQALNENVTTWATLRDRSRAYMEDHLFNGQWFIQQTRRDWTDPTTCRTPEEAQLVQREGPKYQYGNGCLTDGAIGLWFADVAGLETTIDPHKTRSHLNAVHQHNFHNSLAHHANPQRPTYALPHEPGLLLCSWPHNDAPSLPFVYASEVWTGCEYQAAAHLIRLGCVEQGLEIVRAVRQRYDGRTRNPFDEFECGHWYARAMASYDLLPALTGVRYDALTQTLHVAPRLTPPLRAFLSTATGFGVVHIEADDARLEVYEGHIPVDTIDFVK